MSNLNTITNLIRKIKIGSIPIMDACSINQELVIASKKDIFSITVVGDEITVTEAGMSTLFLEGSRTLKTIRATDGDLSEDIIKLIEIFNEEYDVLVEEQFKKQIDDL